MTSGRWGLHGWRVRCGVREYRFLLSWDLHRLMGGDRPPRLVSTWDAERALERNARDAQYFGGSIIERLYLAVTRRADLPSLSPRDLQDHMLSTVLRAVSSGQLVALAVEQSAPPQYSDEPEPVVEPPAEERPPATFDVQVVLDADGSPVGQLSLWVKEPASGEFRSLRTDGSGHIHVAHTVRGTGEVRGEVKGARIDEVGVVVGWGTAPIDATEGGKAGEGGRRTDTSQIRYLVKLESYRVRDGDTLQSVARQAGMAWEELAYFNWGTKDPTEVDRVLEVWMGCATHGARGGRVFTGREEPGLIRIPRPFSKSELPTDAENVLRVRRPRLPFGRCVNAAHQPIARKRFVVLENHRRVYEGKSDANGWLLAPFTWRDTYDVQFPEAGASDEP